tara:strand:- start:23 stop:265 length:243 start_codon:yes stop_codon:yes gene_type:complete
MTLYEFKLLPEQEQYNKLFNEGDFLTYRLRPTSRFALYALEKFFVEVEYDPKNNKIINAVSFISGKKLDKYSNLNLDREI